MKRRLCALVVALLGAACSSSPPAPTGAHPPGDAGLGAEGGGTDTWTSYAAGFFTTYCTSCHNAQDATGRDYSQQTVVAKDRLVMRCGVAAAQDPSWSCASTPVAKQFPIGSGPKPSDAERARIVAWIDAGEPRLTRPAVILSEAKDPMAIGGSVGSFAALRMTVNL